MEDELLDAPTTRESDPLRTRGIVVAEVIILATGIFIVLIALVFIAIAPQMMGAMENEGADVLWAGTLGALIVIALFVSPVVYAFNWRRSSIRFDAGLTEAKFEENNWMRASKIGTYLAVGVYALFAVLDLFDGGGINFETLFVSLCFAFFNLYYVLQTSEKVRSITKI